MSAEVDLRLMLEAIDLARRGIGEVEPNPPVGALVVREDVVVGRGFHRAYGSAHAEVEALDAAGLAAHGATLYVTLEPCCTHGKTPPCVERVVASGVRRVVCAIEDPNPEHLGRGLQRLREHGIAVDVGVAQAEAAFLLARFRSDLHRATPFVIAKWAMSLDGKIATASGDSRWISGEESRQSVHTLRGRVDGIAVGVGTVVADDPALTARPSGPRVATRIVFDEPLRCPITWQALDDGGPPVLLIHNAHAHAERLVPLRRPHVDFIACQGEGRTERLQQALVALKRRGIHRLLVEGGGGLLGALADLRAIDQAVVFIAPRLIGGASAPGPIGGGGVPAVAQALRFEGEVVERLGDDICFKGFVRQPEPVADPPAPPRA